MPDTSKMLSQYQDATPKSDVNYRHNHNHHCMRQRLFIIAAA